MTTQPRRLIRNADDLRGASFRRRVIVPTARDVLNAIERTATDANKEGLGYIIFDVPKSYAAVGDDATLVLEINATILNELIMAGYSVSIREHEHALEYTISWSTELSEREVRMMQDLMKRHTVGQ